MSRRVAITGIGAVTPLGVGADALIERWSAGESGIEDGFGRCGEFDPEEHLSIKAARRADRFTQLSLVACGEALSQVSSLKSAIGHTFGAAGAVEAAATVLALRRGIAPPTVGWEERDESCDLDYVPGEARTLEGNGRPLRAISNSFGFGGHNAVLCLEAA